MDAITKINEAIEYSEKCVSEWQAISQKSHTDRRAGLIAGVGIDYHTARIKRLQAQKHDLEQALIELSK